MVLLLPEKRTKIENSIDLLAAYLNSVAELRRTQISVIKSKGILKAPSAATIRDN